MKMRNPITDIRSLITSILKMSNMASKDAMKIMLNGVCLQSREGKLRVVATNGAALAVEETDIPCPKGFREAIILLEELPKLKTLLKLGGNLSEFFFEQRIDDGVKKLRFWYGNADKALNECLIICLDAEYPDVDRFQKKDCGSFSIGINAEFLLNLAKSLTEKTERNQIKLRIDVDEKLAPIVVSTIDESRYGIIMPVRI